MDFAPLQRIEAAFIGRGIYRLYRQQEIVYVGQATCISGRIHVHWAEGVKEFDAFDYVLHPHVSKAELDILEAREIFRLKPLFNRTLPPTGLHKRIGQIAHLKKVRPRRVQQYIDDNCIQCFLGKYDFKDFEGLVA